MTWDEYEALLKQKQAAQDELKRLSMIYQVQAKQEAALAFRKPIDHYYHFSYKAWCRVSKRFFELQNKVL